MASSVTDEAERDLATYVFDTLPSNIAILDADGTILATNDSWREFAEANGLETAPDSVGTNYLAVADAADDPDADRAAAGIRAVLRGDREQFELEYPCHSPSKNRWFLLRASRFTHDGARYATVAHVDITERKEQEQELQQRRDELAHLNRLNTLVRELIHALQDTDSREAIETAVCDRLIASEVYQGAWIGVRGTTVTGDEMVIPQTTSGIERSSLDDIPAFEGPVKTAVRTGAVQVVDDTATGAAFPDDRQESVLEHDYHTLAAIPLTTGGVTYGVLVVYPPGDQIISEDEQTILADLGEMIAQAIQRVHSQQALSAETVVALELWFPDTDLLFGEVSTEFDCALTLEQRISTNDGGAIYYLNVHGADPGRVSAFLREIPPNCDCTVVREADDDGPARIELGFPDQPNLPTDILSSYGGSMTTARIADGDIFLGVELSPAVDVRTAVDAIREVAPNVELLNKRTIDRSITTGPAFQDQITDQFTPKQETTLKAAYARGYYAWPRDTTVDDLADTFDVSAPTLHYRLRKAHQTLVAAVVDDG